MKLTRISRPAATVAAAAVLLVIGSTGGAIAGSMITGAQIKDNTLTSADVKDGSLKKVDLSAAAVKALRGQQGMPGAVGPAGPTGATGPAGPANTKSIALVVDTSVAGDTSKSVDVGPFSVTAVCRQSAPPAGADYQDYVSIFSSDGQMYVMSPNPDIFVGGPVGFFPANLGTMTATAVTRDGNHAVTVVATRQRSGSECRVALTASSTD